ncbi:MAG: hypothetical protein IIA70_02030 [Proteobacteria bacterium]|nr:hypothetical protein [Pseudomonadota bacterium]
MKDFLVFTDILENIAIIIASLSAVYGGSKGWEVYRKKKQNDLIVEVLEYFYRARDALRRIRNPFLYVGEGGTRERRETESEQEKEIYDRVYVPMERYKKEEAIFQKLESLKYKFIANFGKESAEPFTKLFNALNKIFLASNILRTAWIQQGRRFPSDEAFQDHLERMHKYEGIFWEGAEDPDKFGQEIEATIDEIEVISEKLMKKI